MLKKSVLLQEIGARLFERLNLIRLQPHFIIELGTGQDYFTQKLQKRFQPPQLWVVDISQNLKSMPPKRRWWQKRPAVIYAEAGNIPIPDHSVDLIFSNLALNHCNNLPLVLSELKRLLTPNGLLHFSVFGPDTLKELPAVSHSFIDMHDIGDILQRNQFTGPVLNMERISVEYTNKTNLEEDLMALGLQQAGLLPTIIEKFPTTFEVIYGHAWGSPAPSSLVKKSPNEILVPVSQLLKNKSIK